MCNAPPAMVLQMVIQMWAAVTPTSSETASRATPEPLEGNENAKRNRRRAVLISAVGPGEWRSRTERMAQQQARRLSQLQRTIATMANMLETQTALHEAQW